MKKFLIGISLVSIFAVTLASCCNHEPQVQTEQPKLKSLNSLGRFPYNTVVDEMTVVIIDDCQYIVCNAYSNKDITITHKGNCINPIHYPQQNNK